MFLLNCCSLLPLYLSVVISEARVAALRKFGDHFNILVKFQNYYDESTVYSVSLFSFAVFILSLESFILTCSVTSVVYN